MGLLAFQILKDPTSVLNGIFAYFIFILCMGISYAFWLNIDSYVAWLNRKGKITRWIIYIPLNLIFYLIFNFTLTISISAAISFFCRDISGAGEAFQILVPYIHQTISLPTLLYIVWKTSPRLPVLQVAICSLLGIACGILSVYLAFALPAEQISNLELLNVLLLGTMFVFNLVLGLRYYLLYSEAQREDHPMNYIRWVFKVGSTRTQSPSPV